MQELLHTPKRGRNEWAEHYLEEVLTLLNDREFDAAERYMRALYHVYEPETVFERDYIPEGLEEGLETVNRHSSLFQGYFPSSVDYLESIERLSGEMLEYYTRPIYWKEAGNGHGELESLEPFH